MSEFDPSTERGIDEAVGHFAKSERGRHTLLKLHEWLSENGCDLDDRNKDAFASAMPNRIPNGCR